MEPMGIEPTTSCMQNKRSTKLNYSPFRRLWDSNPYQTDRQPAILAIKLNRKSFIFCYRYKFSSKNKKIKKIIKKKKKIKIKKKNLNIIKYKKYKKIFKKIKI